MQASAKVTLAECKSFIMRCMESVGTKSSHAEALADVLVAADYRGHYSHGLNRLEIYVKDIKSKSAASDKEPNIINQTPATALVDGKNLLGPVVGNFCMNLAVKKAKENGIGWVVAKGSNHYGIAAWYSKMAVNQGLIGMSFTNTSPLSAPTRSKEQFLGTNPLSVGAPAKGEDYFMLDMATTTVALGKIEVQKRKGEPLPPGWAMDKNGKMTTDANNAEVLYPLGGVEETSGYKGYGLSLMVELFCGILSGSAYGSNIRRWKDTSTEANLGQCFVALDPNVFAPGFEDRMSDLMDSCRNLPSMTPNKPVMVPGDPEKKKMRENNKQGGVVYHKSLIDACNELAKSLNVEPIKTEV